jgi:hypothetical protein
MTKNVVVITAQGAYELPLPRYMTDREIVAWAQPAYGNHVTAATLTADEQERYRRGWVFKNTEWATTTTTVLVKNGSDDEPTQPTTPG